MSVPDVMPDNRLVHLTGPVPRAVIRLRARDLGDAQRQYARVRREREDSGAGPSEVAIILEIDIHIADDARTARRELAAAVACDSTTVTYVGTGPGLAGLITDIASASVADGVLLRPVVESASDDGGRRVVRDVLPLLCAVPVFGSRDLAQGAATGV
ncbi:MULTISPECIES: hypothetical protein [Rhodococcus]|uniref:Luciferase-like monooxygenase n=1 Tax=Rhodococcoides kyotonense TaxID=398843 RepID=A0A177YHH1_9NOCA|nr:MULTISPECIES: hypothetical protein [Rhodococcus]NIL74653.1 hypothetical protein [Rhodococcus sp. B10]OAK54679.1 hypothetical protein A3K89_04885 [Rhodococcus kyotonensis]